MAKTSETPDHHPTKFVGVWDRLVNQLAGHRLTLEQYSQKRQLIADEKGIIDAIKEVEAFDASPLLRQPFSDTHRAELLNYVESYKQRVHRAVSHSLLIGRDGHENYPDDIEYSLTEDPDNRRMRKLVKNGAAAWAEEIVRG